MSTMDDNDEDDDAAPATVVTGPLAGAPRPGDLNTLSLCLGKSPRPDDASLWMLGAYHLGEELCTRYSSPMPQPILAVAVNRDTGRVHAGALTNDDDLPPLYLGHTGAASGISEFGQFGVAMSEHLGLPAASGAYDCFLWLGTIISPVVSGTKPQELGDGPGRTAGQQTETGATLRPNQMGADGLSEGRLEGGRQIFGHSGSGPVSVLAHARQAGQLAWTVLTPTEAGGFDYRIDLERLIPGASALEFVDVIAMAGGRLHSLALGPRQD